MWVWASEQHSKEPNLFWNFSFFVPLVDFPVWVMVATNEIPLYFCLLKCFHQSNPRHLATAAKTVHGKALYSHFTIRFGFHYVVIWIHICAEANRSMSPLSMYATQLFQSKGKRCIRKMQISNAFDVEKSPFPFPSDLPYSEHHSLFSRRKLNLHSSCVRRSNIRYTNWNRLDVCDVLLDVYLSMGAMLHHQHRTHTQYAEY